MEAIRNNFRFQYAPKEGGCQGAVSRTQLRGRVELRKSRLETVHTRYEFRDGVAISHMIVVELRGVLAEIEDRRGNGRETRLDVIDVRGDDIQAVVDDFEVAGAFLPEVEHKVGEARNLLGEPFYICVNAVEPFVRSHRIPSKSYSYFKSIAILYS
ncbi:MAG: hypothetical protein WDO73_24625 [Ignavibacteriota bacterium]